MRGVTFQKEFHVPGGKAGFVKRTSFSEGGEMAPLRSQGGSTVLLFRGLVGFFNIIIQLYNYNCIIVWKPERKLSEYIGM